jgi:hypothetical protein
MAACEIKRLTRVLESFGCCAEIVVPRLAAEKKNFEKGLEGRTV